MLEINLQKTLASANGTITLNINLHIKENDFVALSGASGSGKTTLLRMIAGLDTPDSGRISANNTLWFDSNICVPPQKREIGFVFQEYALFPNMTVIQNLLYASKNKALAQKLLNIVDLSTLQDQMPNKLSGGQKQRIALIRALMRNPKILLLDEPLSALDHEMRIKLQDDLLKIHNEFGTTTVLVSHDASEIYKLCNRVIKLEHGLIASDLSPKECFLHNKTTHKFSFSGEVLDIYKTDAIYIAVVAIGGLIVEAALSKNEAINLKKGSQITLCAKSFALMGLSS